MLTGFFFQIYLALAASKIEALSLFSDGWGYIIVAN